MRPARPHDSSPATDPGEPGVESALVWPPPPAEMAALEIVELHLGELRTGLPRSSRAMASTLARRPTSATDHTRDAQAPLSALPQSSRHDIVRLNAQIRGLLALIGRRAEDYPDALIAMSPASNEVAQRRRS